MKPAQHRPPANPLTWSTACVDWEDKILAKRSLVPAPLFPDEAAAALEIFHSLRMVDVVGRPRMGDACRPWITDFVGAVFGSYDASTGRRLIQEYFLHIAKKNGKSTLAAGVMLTALLRNWRQSAEYYILAPTREVADNSFAPARDMIRADNELHALLHVQENFRTITHRTTRASLKVVSADSETVGGKRTVGLFVDELWQFGKRANAGPMLREAKGGLASRHEGFVIYATTQSDAPPAGVFDELLSYFRDVRDGNIDDRRSLGVIYEFPKRLIDSGEFRKPANFYVPNPNLGASVDDQYLVAELAKAERAGQASLVNFCAKHLNVQVGMAMRADGWAGARIWNRGADKNLTLDELLARCEVVCIGLDGGGLDDLLGVGVIGRERGTKKWLGWAHGLVSSIGLARRKANLAEYRRFAQQGDLTIFRFAGEDAAEIENDPDIADLWLDVPPAPEGPGVLPVDIQYVVDLVRRVSDLGLLAQVGVDAAGIGGIVDALADIGITQDAEKLDAVRQGIGLMGAFKTIERKLADRSFVHCGSEMLVV